MDILMPNVDGYDATRLIRNYETENEMTPCYIVGLTADSGQEVKTKALSVGMNECLNKPLKLD